MKTRPSTLLRGNKKELDWGDTWENADDTNRRRHMYLQIACDSFKVHANGRNIVGPNMLRPFSGNHNNVGTC